MAAVSTLRWLVAPDVPGCPYPAIDRAIAIAAREWCALTQTALEDISFATQPGVQRYDIEPMDGHDIARVVSVAFGRNEIAPMRVGTLQRKLDGAGGTPRHFWVEGTELWFDYVPQGAVEVIVQVAVKPRIASNTLPDDAAEGEAATAIAARAKRELMTGKHAWSDLQLAAWNEGEFQRLVLSAINLRSSRGTNAPLRVSPAP